MIDFIENIDERNIEPILTRVHFNSNDYNTYSDDASLEGHDSIKIKEKSSQGITISLCRELKTDNGSFFDISVSFDIIIPFKEPFDSFESISDKKILDSINENKALFIDFCMARISMIISFIVALIGDGTPIITPPTTFFCN